MTKTAATAERLGLIHDKLADWCENMLDATIKDEDGKAIPLMRAAEANVIKGFLKDNAITAPTGTDTRLGALERKLKEKQDARKNRSYTAEAMEAAGFDLDSMPTGIPQ